MRSWFRMRWISASSAIEICWSLDATANRQRPSDSFSVVARGFGELERHLVVGGAAEEQVAGLGQADDHGRLFRRQPAFAHDQRLHRARLFRAHLAIGVRHAAEQVGKARQVPRPRRVEAIERLDQLAQRRGFLRVAPLLHAQPRQQLPDAHSPGFLLGV